MPSYDRLLRRAKEQGVEAKVEEAVEGGAGVRMERGRMNDVQWSSIYTATISTWA